MPLLLHFLYEALERHTDFVVDVERIALHSEALGAGQRAEVQPQRAVETARDGDVLPHEHVRVALVHLLARSLEEREVGIAAAELVDAGILVAAQHAQIALARGHAAVVVQECFQVDGEFRVRVPALLCAIVDTLAGGCGQRFVTCESSVKDFALSARLL